MVISQAPNNVATVLISNASAVHHNLSVPVLYEHAVRRGEGKLLQGGTFAVRSGARAPRGEGSICKRHWLRQQSSPLAWLCYDSTAQGTAYGVYRREPRFSVCARGSESCLA